METNPAPTPTNRLFKAYVYISLFIIVVLLAALVGAIGYAGDKVSGEASTVKNDVNSFNQNVNSVNSNLQSINSQLQDLNNTESKVTTVKL